MARRVWNMVETNGSVDWNGVAMAAGLFGIADIDGLVMRLQVIKTHLRNKDK